jgi:hypothetical protein
VWPVVDVGQDAWIVWRQAEHGNQVSVARFGNRHAAEALVAAFEQHHRRQLSWVEVSTEL